MALIQCKTCGATISDKAKACPKCGAPLEMKIPCTECGMLIPQSAVFCPSCGCPNNFYRAQSKHQSVDNPYTQFEALGADDREKRVQRFLVQNKKFFSPYYMMNLKERLLFLSDEQMSKLEYFEFKDPIVVFVISVVIGYLGVDRFMLGDTTNGVLKLVLTLICGLGLVWWLVDLFLIINRTKEYNETSLDELLNNI